MDGKVLLEAVEALVKIKKVDRNMVFDALEMVLLTAYKKESGSNAKASVSLNRETGEYKIYEEKTVVDEIHEDSENAINEITVEEAKKIDRSYEAGDMLRIDVTPKNFGRVAAQAAKQVMIQKLREAERGSIYDEFSGREGDVITGVVKWNESRTIFVDLGRVEGILPFAEQIEGEEFQPNDKIKCYVLEVRKTTKGPEIILSRTHPGLLKRLFELEDIVRWDEDPAIYIANALSPAKVVSVSVWEEEKSSYVIVPDYQLSLAIGKAGQNARLAAKLTNWKIDIKSETQANEEGFGETDSADLDDDILGDIESDMGEEAKE